MTVLLSCDAPPPDYIPDYEEAELYGRVLKVAHEQLGVRSDVAVHPYLAIVQDTLGYSRARLDEFEYERSAALRILQHSDSTVVFCDFDARGICTAPSYLVLSQIRRFADRDAELVVFGVDSRNVRFLRVRLRYHRGAWHIAGSQPAI